eukprot:6206484-Pleurochrysis_carterae.AAC.2
MAISMRSAPFGAFGSLRVATAELGSDSSCGGSEVPVRPRSRGRTCAGVGTSKDKQKVQSRRERGRG